MEELSKGRAFASVHEGQRSKKKQSRNVRHFPGQKSSFASDNSSIPASLSSASGGVDQGWLRSWMVPTLCTTAIYLTS